MCTFFLNYNTLQVINAGGPARPFINRRILREMKEPNDKRIHQNIFRHSSG